MNIWKISEVIGIMRIQMKSEKNITSVDTLLYSEIKPKTASITVRFRYMYKMVVVIGRRIQPSLH
jgi:hypothetical protein